MFLACIDLIDFVYDPANFVFSPKWGDYISRVSQMVHDCGASRHVVIIPDAERLCTDYSASRESEESTLPRSPATERQPSVPMAHRTGEDAPAPVAGSEFPEGYTWVDEQAMEWLRQLPASIMKKLNELGILCRMGAPFFQRRAGEPHDLAHDRQCLHFYNGLVCRSFTLDLVRIHATTFSTLLMWCFIFVCRPSSSLKKLKILRCTTWHACRKIPEVIIHYPSAGRWKLSSRTRAAKVI